VNKSGIAQAVHEQGRRGISGTAGRWESARGKNHNATACQIGEWKKYIVEGQRLEVNPSVEREMANLSAAL
jgi:hypothetical protein